MEKKNLHGQSQSVASHLLNAHPQNILMKISQNAMMYAKKNEKEKIFGRLKKRQTSPFPPPPTL